MRENRASISQITGYLMFAGGWRSIMRLSGITPWDLGQSGIVAVSIIIRLDGNYNKAELYRGA
jgi:hypothetical protein